MYSIIFLSWMIIVIFCFVVHDYSTCAHMSYVLQVSHAAVVSDMREGKVMRVDDVMFLLRKDKVKHTLCVL